MEEDIKNIKKLKAKIYELNDIQKFTNNKINQVKYDESYEIIDYNSHLEQLNEIYEILDYKKWLIQEELNKIFEKNPGLCNMCLTLYRFDDYDDQDYYLVRKNGICWYCKEYKSLLDS